MAKSTSRKGAVTGAGKDTIPLHLLDQLQVIFDGPDEEAKQLTALVVHRIYTAADRETLWAAVAAPTPNRSGTGPEPVAAPGPEAA